MKGWATILLDAATWSLVVLMILGHQWAENVVHFFVWAFGLVCVAVSLGVLLLSDKDLAKLETKPKVQSDFWRGYDFATEISLVLTFAALGLYGLASIRLVGFLMLRLAMSKWRGAVSRAGSA